MSPLRVFPVTEARAFGGRRQFHIALPILRFNCIIPRRLHCDPTIAIFDVAVAIYLAQIHVLGVRNNAHLAFGLRYAQIVGVQRQITRQRCHIHLCHRRVHMNRPVHALHVHIAEEFSIDCDLAR